jgi:hypothetical protein
MSGADPIPTKEVIIPFMSGIAGYLGTGAEGLDASAVASALSFTGLESVDEARLDGFFGLAVTHAQEAARCPAAFRDDQICILLDGYITDIEGEPFNPANALSLCAELYRREGLDFARRINGSFSLAILDRRSGTLHLLCDRLATRHLYVMRKGGAVAFASRLEALQDMGLEPTRKLNRQGFVEFLAYGRMLVSEMWEGVRSVPPATALSFSSDGEDEHIYYDVRFTYDRNRASLEENAERLACALQETAERSIAGFDRVGLLLSGGLDSRTVLSCLPEATICYTACDRPNPETWIAAKAARMRGCRHVLLKRSPMYYSEILPAAARTSEGAFACTHAHMENLCSRMKEISGGTLLGGFLFNVILRAEGMTEQEQRWGTVVFHQLNLLDLRNEAEVERAFLDLEALHMSGLNILAADLRKEADSYLRDTIHTFVNECSSQVVGTLDFFDLYAFKRARTWLHSLFLHSIRNNLSERCPALDNSLVDILLTTPVQQRFGSALLKRALAILDPRMLSLCDANTLLPASAGYRLRTAKPLKRLYNRLIVHVGRRTIYRHMPAWTQSSGSWHNFALFWRYGPLPGRLEELLHDEAAMRDGIIDPSAAREFLGQHLRGAAYHTETLSRLLDFLEWRSTTP